MEGYVESTPAPNLMNSVIAASNLRPKAHRCEYRYRCGIGDNPHSDCVRLGVSSRHATLPRSVSHDVYLDPGYLSRRRAETACTEPQRHRAPLHAGAGTRTDPVARTGRSCHRRGLSRGTSGSTPCQPGCASPYSPVVCTPPVRTTPLSAVWWPGAAVGAKASAAEFFLGFIRVQTRVRNYAATQHETRCIAAPDANEAQSHCQRCQQRGISNTSFACPPYNLMTVRYYFVRCAFAPHRCAFTQHSRITTTSLSPISSRGHFSYGAQERNLIHIMFGGVAGVLAARRVIRDFASGCGFSKSKLCVP